MSTPSDHRGRPLNGNHQPSPQSWIFESKTPPNRFVRPVADSQGQPYPAMEGIGKLGKHWYADRAADAEFASHAREEGVFKPMKNENLSMSIDKVGPYYAPSVYNPETDQVSRGMTGSWTKWGARRQGKKVAEGAKAMPKIVYSAEHKPFN